MSTEHGMAKVWVPTVLFILIAFFMLWDIAVDYANGSSRLHMAIEFAAVVAVGIVALFFWRQLLVNRHIRRELAQHLRAAHEASTRMHEQNPALLHDLRVAIEKQFHDWSFSDTEKEVAFYLLNGLSLKEVAQQRESTFQSVRQQAHVLYRKAGLAGRAELSAFFLGGLLEPEENGEATARPGSE